MGVQGLVIIGAGAAGTGPLIWAAQNGKLEEWLNAGIAVVEIDGGRVVRLAAIDAPPERHRPLGRPEAADRKPAGAASAAIGDQRVGGAVHHEHRHRPRGMAGIS